MRWQAEMKATFSKIDKRNRYGVADLEMSHLTATVPAAALFRLSGDI